MARFPRTISVLVSLFASCLLMVACGGSDTEEPAVCGEGAGNEIGIGKACTKGGDECPADPTVLCDVDFDDRGLGICISVDCQTDADCGAGAECCKPDVSPVTVCLPTECLPTECIE